METRSEYVLRLTLTEEDANALLECFTDMVALPPAILTFADTLAEFVGELE